MFSLGARAMHIVSGNKMTPPSLYEGTGGNVCHTALSSAKQNSATAYATGHLAQPLQRRCDKHYLLHLRREKERV
jgi:hypothetical protein